MSAETLEPPLAVSLEISTEAPRIARGEVSRYAADRALTRTELDVLRLLASELVTNALQHAAVGPGDHLELRLTCSSSQLRLEVWDPGPGFAPGPRPEPSGPVGGWGLGLVEQAATRWGVHREGGTTVWLEIDRT